MSDVHSPSQRSRNMAAIKGKNTKPELIIRSGLHKRGFRFRLHQKDIPGKPDLFLAKYRAAIFIHGCFWHRHECELFKWPKTRPEFWRQKIDANHTRDVTNRGELLARGFRVLYVWECALRGQTKMSLECLLSDIADWIHSTSSFNEIPAA